MTFDEIMHQLATNGSDQTKKVLTRHGAREPFFGVKIAFLKKIQKKVKRNYELSKQLYGTGNSDAMYLAGLIAEPKQMTKKDLQAWVEGAYWYLISDYTVAGVASESNFAIELALEWIQATNQFICSAGWSTLSSYAAVTSDEHIDIALYTQLLYKVKEGLHGAKNRVRYSMNNFIISTGSYVPALTPLAKELAAHVGKVSVNMGGTACKVPLAAAYIEKVEAKGKLGKKRKSAIG